MYWKINDKWEIVELIRQLPKSNINISWLDKLSKEELIELWYYEVVWVSEPLKEWQTYWEPTYTITETNIEERKEVINKSLEDYKKEKINSLSERCNSEILNKYSYETQTNLLRESMRLQFALNMWREIDNNGVAYIANVDAEIEAMRNEYRTQKETINWLESYEEISTYFYSLFSNEKVW